MSDKQRETPNWIKVAVNYVIGAMLIASIAGICLLGAIHQQVFGGPNGDVMTTVLFVIAFLLVLAALYALGKACDAFSKYHDDCAKLDESDTIHTYDKHLSA